VIGKVAIDKSDKWWLGESPDDIKEYLEAYTENSYPISEFRLAKCQCGGQEFLVEYDSDEGVVRRTCVNCKVKHFVCDSEENYDGGKLKKLKCVECKSTSMNIGVGFSLYDDGEVRWLYNGERCSKCGVLGSCNDWKIGYAPSKHLIDQV
jgi:hypothetical protein